MPDVNVETGISAAAVAGATAAAIANSSRESWVRKAAEGFCGALVGVFCGPAAANWIGLADSHYRMACGFAVGAGGLLLLTTYLEIIKSEGFRNWISSRLFSTK